MKSCIFLLLASFLAVLIAAAPNPIKNELKDTNSLTTTNSTLHPRTGVIKLGLGTQGVNIGDMTSSLLYGRVYESLQRICDRGAQMCTHNVAPFQVHVRTSVQIENVYISVDSSQYHSNDKIYYLLIGSIAGAFERGTWNDYHCRVVQGGARHCNSIDYASIELPGDNYMKVRFRSTKGLGSFDCMKVLAAARTYVDTLMPEMKAAVGDADLWMDEKCVW